MRQRTSIFLLLLAIPLLGGGKCAFYFSSGGGDPLPKDPNRPSNRLRTGSFVGTPIRGLAFTSGSFSGVTGENGEYHYEEGGVVSFRIGDIRLGEPIAGQDRLTLTQLVSGGGPEDYAVINMARLLKSLDAEPGDEAITIPDSVRRDAVVTNSQIFWEVESLDFADNEAFVNAGSALVAVLTRDYPFAASLVDANAAQEYVLRPAQATSISQPIDSSCAPEKTTSGISRAPSGCPDTELND